MKFICFLIAFMAQIAAGIGTAPAQPQELFLIHAGTPGSLFEMSAAEFVRRLESDLPASHRIGVIANPALGDGLALLDSVKNGRAAFALTSGAMIALGDRFAIFELPFLIQNRAQLAVIRRALLPRFLQPEAALKGFHILGVWESGFRQFTNDLQPIVTPADMRGMKFAVPPANPWREKVFRAFGAEPMAMAGRTLPEALQTRIADGQEAPLAEIAALGLKASQRHLAMSDHLYSPAFLVTSEAVLRMLPGAVREAVLRQALALEDWIQNTAIAMESELIDRLDQDMELSHIDLKAFLTVTRPLYGEFARAVPDGVRMIEILEKAGETSPEEGRLD